jgi:hypothetical protein
MIPCFSCHGLVPLVIGPVHPYMKSSPGCWKLYGEILALEYSLDNYDPLMHRITVDTYAIQHPGEPERRAINSVNLHLIRLYLVLHNQVEGSKANEVMKILSENTKLKEKFVWLEPPSFENTITVVDVWNAHDRQSHSKVVTKWGLSVLERWIEKHGNRLEELIKETVIKEEKK